LVDMVAALRLEEQEYVPGRRSGDRRSQGWIGRAYCAKAPMWRSAFPGLDRPGLLREGADQEIGLRSAKTPPDNQSQGKGEIVLKAGAFAFEAEVDEFAAEGVPFVAELRRDREFPGLDGDLETD
jgi:hypothetical protein